MKAIATETPRQELRRELRPEFFVRKTNFGKNEIYIFTAAQAPLLMREVGRLRELSFRQSGGGTGNELDIDPFDTQGEPYRQLVVWNPEDQEIVGGYRFLALDAGNLPRLFPNGMATTHLFDFSPRFVREFLPHTIELGRSFVQPKYQSSQNHNRQGIFSLDNLWDGLGSLVVDYPHVRYFLGKVTMYLNFDPYGRDLILHFLRQVFPDACQLARPWAPLELHQPETFPQTLFLEGGYPEKHRQLVALLRDRGLSVPPLINAYMNLSSTMRTFGTSLNSTFGQVEETGILISLADIYETKIRRYVEPYARTKSKD